MKHLLTLVTLLFLLTNQAISQQIVTENGKTYKLHTVEKGEGLYRLSVNHNTTQEAIIAANPELRQTGLVEGSVIRIPMVSASAVKVAGVPGEYSQYVVQRGETAYSITQKHGMTLAEFYNVNPDCKSGVGAGQIVNVKYQASQQNSYKLHVIAQGETLYSIRRNYGVKAEKIIAANPSLDVNSLPVGTSVRIPDTEIPDEDSNYYYHRIAQGETLYKLCIRYNVMQEKIKEVNPDINWSALSIGQVVAVPKAQKDEEFIEHTVKKRETLYSITSQYGVTEAEVQKWNKGVDTKNLQKDMTLKIVDRSESDDATPATANPRYVGTESAQNVPAANTYNYKREGSPTISVGLMLPFDADNEMRTMRDLGHNNESAIYYFKTRRYIEFYEGVKMAVDSFVSSGANIDLHVYDVPNLNSIGNILGDPSTKMLDMIIGPSHIDRMRLASDFAQENQIPIVFPFMQMDSLLLENPYAFQVSETDTVTGLVVAEEMVKRSAGHRMMILKTDSKAKLDAWRLSTLKRLCKERGVEYVEMTYDITEPENFLTRLDTINGLNTIVIPTTNEARINSVLVSIASVMEQKPAAQLTLLGYGEWLTFQTIEVDVFHKLSTTIYSLFGVDENDAQTLYTLKKMRKMYFAEPVAFTPYFQKLKNNSGFSEYTLWGYDIAMQFIGARIAFGPEFHKNINDYRPHLLQSNFRFSTLTNWGGAANVGLKELIFTPKYQILVKNIN